ncbi:MAG: nitrogenase [Gloeomargarita sp. SKYG116]|nr:nitrogenase [Gloeomargarita sp. SKYG116]MCS7226779.1 nitrogenase [Gloeomargarita sp. SKYB31]MDW8400342.1 Mo-dependent nitrogenase C-terminal domain-containing protein [Gloeomargarita sp. SKYGB_i_bin116]
MWKNVSWSVWAPLKNWLNQIEIRDVHFAHQICRWIPARCPFEREIRWRGHLILKIPALCHLNPLYGELMALRWRALCFLAEQCGEDVSCYCH